MVGQWRLAERPSEADVSKNRRLVIISPSQGHVEEHTKDRRDLLRWLEAMAEYRAPRVVG